MAERGLLAHTTFVHRVGSARRGCRGLIMDLITWGAAPWLQLRLFLRPRTNGCLAFAACPLVGPSGPRQGERAAARAAAGTGR